jgi:hypothetical protein
MVKKRCEYDITINNILDVEPMEVFLYMHSKFDNVVVPQELESADDLTEVSEIIGWCSNVKAYLNALYTYLDTLTRSAKAAGDKELSAGLIARRNIIKNYQDHISDIFSGTSRVATIYFEKQKELRMDGRNNTIQYGGRTYAERLAG